MAEEDTDLGPAGEPNPHRHCLYFDDSDTEDSTCSSTTDGEEPLPLTSLPPRTIKKEGYLYKQGGQNNDKGWKRRYMRFDGQSFRYYLNEKSVQSLRIIPVTIMLEANHEVKRNSVISVQGILGGSSREYKFSLKTVNRTYLFGTDNHDNCVHWISFLAEAIINKKKENNTGGDDVDGPMHNPDIQGTIKFRKKNKKYHAALKGDIFRYYYNKEDFEIDCPVHELFMIVSKVTKEDNTLLKIRSAPDQTFMLQFDNPAEADRWFMHFTEASANIGDDSVVKHIRENPDNRTCADCTARETNWASINLGVVLCIKCAGLHRALGVNYSKVRSLRMDNIFRENANLLQLFTTIGNKNANAFWYANHISTREINEETPESVREKHIKQKYVSKDFVDNSPLKSTDLNMDFIEAVRKGDVLGAMRFYESGADINFIDEESELDALGIANKRGHQIMMEYLEQNKSRKAESRRPASIIGNTESGEFVQNRQAVYHDGYLEKTGPRMRGFLKRWFVLQNKCLSYYDDKHGPNSLIEKGSVNLDHVTCVAVTSCNARQFCFDLTNKEKKRLYRFAISTREERRQWIDSILQVIRPDVIPNDQIYHKTYSIAGFFYIKQHSQGRWVKSWLGVGAMSIDIIYMNELQLEEIPIDRKKVKVYKYKTTRSSKMVDDDVTEQQLDGNMAVELQVEQRTIRIQGFHPDDTEKVFAILNSSLNT